MAERKREQAGEQERYRDLVAWQVASKLGRDICKVAESRPQDWIYGLTSQLRRMAVSVSANTAEGYDGRGRSGFPRRLDIAGGFAGKAETRLLFALELKHSEAEEYERLAWIRARTAELIDGLLASAETNRRPR